MSFRTFNLSEDVASVVTAINEVIAISSSLFTIGSGDANVKFYDNIATGSNGVDLGGYWQSVFDSSPTSSQSTALFDMTFGYDTASLFNVPATASSSQNEKIKVYREIASLLMGSSDAPFVVNGSPANECFFFLVKRGLMKDEIKKGSFALSLSGTASGTVTLVDTGAPTSFKQDVGGDWAPLLSGTTPVGQIWYNAGIAVIPARVAGMPWSQTAASWSGSTSLSASMLSGTIDHTIDGLRGHTTNLSFHNQTNLFSTVYFCRATNGEFNYSSNPTFLDSAQRIIPTSGSNVLQTRAYITAIGLYDANDNLLAVGKTSKPLTKTPDTELTFRLRLDF